MSIKLLLLKSGEDIISDIHEMVVGEEEQRRVIGYYLDKPCVVKLLKDPGAPADDPNKGLKVSLYPWMPLAKEQKIPVIADWVVTVVEPVDNLKEMYQEDIVNHGKGNQNSVSSKSTDSD